MYFEKEEDCRVYLNTNSKSIYRDADGNIGCNGTFDDILCWEAIPANTTTKIQCPDFSGVFDSTKYLYKHCMFNGLWEGYNKTKKESGYTNYETCLTEVGLDQLNKHKYLKNYGLTLNISLYVELIGIILSLICLLTSLFIFTYHKSLRCKRTKIHLNLFVSILFQIIIRMVLFIDTFAYKIKNPNKLSFESLLMQYDKAICPILYTLLEYFQSCNFMWMLNEGIYLNVLLTYSIFDDNRRNMIIFFYIIGWVFPAITVLSWFITMFVHIGIDQSCWFGYYSFKIYWIIETPISIALIINIFCLANVIRILTNKLRENRTSEIIKIKKSVKAAVLLLPLLGITHITEIFHEDLSNWVLNLIYSVINSFLVFYQGVFLSILYCFMNNEVKNVIRRHWFDKIKFKSRFFDCRSNSRFANDRNGLEMEKLVDTDMPITTLNTNTKSNSETTIA